MLKVKNLSFAYKTKEILKDINFNIEDGQTVFLLGENGCGKTTLLKNILALLKANTGTIYYDDINLLNISNKERAKIISYISQLSSPYYSYSVLTHVSMGKTNNVSTFTSIKDDRTKIEEVLARVNIAHLIDRDISSLSGGERQLVHIARSLYQEAKVFLFDEPTSALDYKNQVLTLREIKNLAKMGKTTLITSHNIEQALNYADKIILLEAGSILAYDKPSLILEDLSALYNIKIEKYKEQYIIIEN